MKASVELRKKLGLPQEQMAQFLSISRSHLSLYELGLRDLSSKALTKLAELEILLLQSPLEQPEALPHLPGQQQKAARLLDKHAVDHYHKLHLAQPKLAAIKEKDAQQTLLLATINKLRATTKNGTGSKTHRAWLNMLETEVLGQIEQNSIHVQAVLQLQIEGLQHQHERARQLKQELL